MLEIIAERAMHISFFSFIPRKSLFDPFFFDARLTHIFHLLLGGFTGGASYVTL
jgi:hypothetical protein